MAAILEMDENLATNFTIFEAAPQVSAVKIVVGFIQMAFACRLRFVVTINNN